MDQARSRTFSDALSAHQSCGLLARTLAEPRSVIQQLARKFFRRITQRISRRRRASGLVGQFDPARDCKDQMIGDRLCQPRRLSVFTEAPYNFSNATPKE